MATVATDQIRHVAIVKWVAWLQYRVAVVMLYIPLSTITYHMESWSSSIGLLKSRGSCEKEKSEFVQR
jgi:hypothetical protein